MAHLIVVDAGNLAMRAYHGIPAEAPDHHVDGFRIMLLRLLREWRPTHLVVALDSLRPSFRVALYPEYKAGRTQRPGPSSTELVESLLPVLESWNVMSVRVEGYEADDVMATLARRGASSGSLVSLVTNDSDLFQCVTDGIRVIRYLPNRDVEIVDPRWLQSKYGILPHQFVDYRVLVGDTSDNIPRVGETLPNGRSVGVTEKLATSYLRRFGSLDALYNAVPMLPAREGRWLEVSKERVKIVRELVCLRDDLELVGVEPQASSVDRLRLQ